MTSTLQVSLDKHGAYLYGKVPVPLRLEILDSHLNVQESRLIHTESSPVFLLQPGTYVVVATTPSGTQVQEVVDLTEDETVTCQLPVHQISPHESHEWAYLTQKSGFPTAQHLSGGKKLDAEGLKSQKFDRAWLRLWRKVGSEYQIQPDPSTRLRAHSVDTDGVVYIGDFDTEDAWCLQVGGPHIPWKCVALPTTSSIKVLVRPSTWQGSHPLQVIVASDDLALEGLLAFLKRGELEEAQQLERSQGELAERFLQQKQRDETAAAIGGYYLLRIQALERLHDWANNLANWFHWMSDGAIIHAWQLISEYRRLGEQRTELLDAARDRLLEAVSRGFPTYTEGLRLLRDGLLLFERLSEGEDLSVQKALQQAGQYMAVADWNSSTTTFTGETPDDPSPTPQTEMPELMEGCEFLGR